MLELIAAALKSGSATVFSLLLTAITVKIVAIFTGPAGVGAWSLLRQCLQAAVSIGTGSGTASIVRGVSQLSGSERKQFIRTAAVMYLVLGSAIALVLILLSTELSRWIGTLSADVFALLSLPLLMWIFRDFVFALLNGAREIGRLSIAQISGPLAGALLAYPIAKMVAGGNYGGFIFLMFATSAISAIVSVYFILHLDLRLEFRGGPWWTRDSFREFASLAGVMAGIAIFSSVTLFLCRVLIARYRGIDEAGYFDTAWSLGLTYIGLILNAFGTFYLPKLWSLDDKAQSLLIGQVAKLTVMLIGPLIVTIVIIKPWIISVFYSNTFLPSLEILQWLLVADYLKISTWVFSIVVLARGLERTYLVGNVLWDSGLLLGTSLILYFHLSTSCIGLVVLGLHFLGLYGYKRVIRRSLTVHLPLRIWLVWLGGFGCVLLATAIAGHSANVDLINFWIVVLSMCVSACCITGKDISAIQRLIVRLRA
jgi:PST family polysaccharide transporter